MAAGPLGESGQYGGLLREVPEQGDGVGVPVPGRLAQQPHAPYVQVRSVPGDVEAGAEPVEESYDGGDGRRLVQLGAQGGESAQFLGAAVADGLELAEPFDESGPVVGGGQHAGRGDVVLVQVQGERVGPDELPAHEREGPDRRARLLVVVDPLVGARGDVGVLAVQPVPHLLGVPALLGGPGEQALAEPAGPAVADAAQVGVVRGDLRQHLLVAAEVDRGSAEGELGDHHAE